MLNQDTTFRQQGIKRGVCCHEVEHYEEQVCKTHKNIPLIGVRGQRFQQFRKRSKNNFDVTDFFFQ